MVKTFVIRITGGYWARGEPYQAVPRDRATRVDRKTIDQILSHLRVVGLRPVREKA